MKTLFLFLIIYSLQNLVYSENDEATIRYKTFPKKVHPSRSHVKILNPGSYVKTYQKDKSFTRFMPPLRAVWPSENDKAGSASFHLDRTFDGNAKTRVKKLPYYDDFKRSKRAVNESAPAVTTEASINAPSTKPTQPPKPQTDNSTAATKPQENKPSEAANPKNATSLRRAGHKVRHAKRPHKRGSQKHRLHQKLDLKRKHDAHRRRSRHSSRHQRKRILRAGDDKVSVGKVEGSKAAKEKVEGSKVGKAKAERNKADKAKPVGSKAPKEIAEGNKKVKAEGNKVAKPKAEGKKLAKAKTEENKVAKVTVKAKKDEAKKGSEKAPSKPKRRAPREKARGRAASRRLIAARDAAVEDYPYVVSIQKDGEHWCAGAILNPQLIISTANCFWKFTCCSYDGQTEHINVNEVHKDLFASKNKLVISLPPTSASLYKHALRTAYQAGHIWGNDLKTEVSIPCPSSWGWTKEKESWTPEWSAFTAIWSQLSLLDHCGCKSGCETMRCGCRRVSVPCTAQCKSCKGGCTNQKSKAISRMKIRAGAHSIDEGGQTAYIAEVRKHPGWSIRKLPQNDIALALLDRQLKFSDSVHGVDLPNKAMIPPFDDVWITSYGSERRDGIYSRLRMTLQVIHAQLMETDKCHNITFRFGVPLHDSFFCVEQIGRRAPCTRDTGAPAVSDGVLWGLASWGLRKLCGTQRFPSMFTYIADLSNMEFIVNATSEMMAEERKSPFLDRQPIQPRNWAKEKKREDMVY